jgi:signal peptidase I
MRKIDHRYRAVIFNLLKISIIISILWIVLFLIFDHIVFNITISEPQGYYWTGTKTEYYRNDIVLICVEDEKSINIMHQLKLPFETNRCKLNTPYLLKKIKGIPGDEIKITKDGIYINNILQLNSKLLTNYKAVKLNPLKYQKIQLKSDEFFLLGDTPHSYDSRYFGIIKKSQIKFYGRLFWKRQKPLLM